MGCAAFKAVEARLRAWWVRLLPLPPYEPPAPSVRITGKSKIPVNRGITLDEAKGLDRELHLVTSIIVIALLYDERLNHPSCRLPYV